MMSPKELWKVVREGMAGFLVAAAIGVAARLISREVPRADALVVAVVLGMLVRAAIGTRAALFFKLVPGITTVEAVFLPLGVLLYGKNLELDVFVRAHPAILLQSTLIVVVTFVAMVGIGRLAWFGLSRRMLYMLGFGSAVCGASAIAITAPVTACEPDETSVALVDNSIAVVLAVAFLALAGSVIAPEPHRFAVLAGETLHQTAFVKRALVGLPAQVVELGMAVKAFRIALLVVSIPVVSYLLRKRVTVPWYMIAFIAVAVLFTFVHAPALRDVVGEVQAIALPMALATVGLRADLKSVVKRLLKPLVLVLLVFAIDVGVFFLTRGIALG